MKPKLNQETAARIRALYRTGVPGKILAHRFDIAGSTVSMIIRNRTWKDPAWQAELSLFDPRSPTRSPGAGIAFWCGKVSGGV